jgi:hypothetical protein
MTNDLAPIATTTTSIDAGDASPVGEISLPGRPVRGLRSLALSGYTLGLGALGAVIASGNTDPGPFTTISWLPA